MARAASSQPVAGGGASAGSRTLPRSSSSWLLLLEDVDRRAGEGVLPRARRSEYMRHLWEELAEPGISAVPVARLVDNLAEVGISLDDPRLKKLQQRVTRPASPRPAFPRPSYPSSNGIYEAILPHHIL